MPTIKALYIKPGRKIKQLQQLFVKAEGVGTDASWRKFGDWINSLFAPGGLLVVKPLDCRHAQLRPANVKPCGVAGTVDAKKGVGIRFTTLLANAKLYLAKSKGGPQLTLHAAFGGPSSGDLEGSSLTALGIEGAASPNLETSAVSAGEDHGKSTKMRVAHLAVLQVAFGSARDVGKLKLAYAQLRADAEMVLHNCGCGLDGCCEPTHLRFGAREVNDMDKCFHVVMKQPCIEGCDASEAYHSLLAEVRKRDGGQYVF